MTTQVFKAFAKYLLMHHLSMCTLWIVFFGLLCSTSQSPSGWGALVQKFSDPSGDIQSNSSLGSGWATQLYTHSVGALETRRHSIWYLGCMLSVVILLKKAAALRWALAVPNFFAFSDDGGPCAQWDRRSSRNASVPFPRPVSAPWDNPVLELFRQFLWLDA